MSTKMLTSLAFAAGCALAIAAMPALAQTYPPAAPLPAYPPSAVAPAPAAPPPATEMVTNGPQASAADYGWSARRNVAESAQYDRLLKASPGFRAARVGKECGPISDPQLHAQCVASFQEYEPTMYGSSTPPRRYRQHAGAGY